MKEYPVPEGDEQRQKALVRLQNRTKFSGIFTVVFGVVAMLCFLAALVVLIVFEMGDFNDKTKTLLYILAGSFAGGAVVFALLAFLFSKFMKSARDTELDFRERLHGQNCFFVGEGTLAEMAEDSMRVFAEDGSGEILTVPFSEMRFFSVCTRNAPKEKGEWSVVFEIPVKYLAKQGMAKAGDPPALVETEAKERLYECLNARGLELLGEKREEKPQTAPFTRVKKFDFPDKKSRQRALILLVIGAILAAAGVPSALFWNPTAGALFCFVGLFLLIRSAYNYATAKSVLSLYEEGIMWREKGKGGIFLKWDEIITVGESEREGFRILDVTCLYGIYHFPNPEGVAKFVSERFPEKMEKGA